MTEDQQGFHLHTSRFEANKLFWGPGFSDKGYITESPLLGLKIQIKGIKSYFVLYGGTLEDFELPGKKE